MPPPPSETAAKRPEREGDHAATSTTTPDDGGRCLHVVCGCYNSVVRRTWVPCGAGGPMGVAGQRVGRCARRFLHTTENGRPNNLNHETKNRQHCPQAAYHGSGGRSPLAIAL